MILVSYFKLVTLYCFHILPFSEQKADVIFRYLVNKCGFIIFFFCLFHSTNVMCLCEQLIRSNFCLELIVSLILVHLGMKAEALAVYQPSQ